MVFLPWALWSTIFDQNLLRCYGLLSGVIAFIDTSNSNSWHHARIPTTHLQSMMSLKSKQKIDHCWHIANMTETRFWDYWVPTLSQKQLVDITPHQLSVNINISSSNSATAEKSVIIDGFCIYNDEDESNRYLVCFCLEYAYVRTLHATQAPVHPAN